MGFQELGEATSHSVTGFSKGLIARSQFIASKDSFCGWHPALQTEDLKLTVGIHNLLAIGRFCGKLKARVPVSPNPCQEN